VLGPARQTFPGRVAGWGTRSRPALLEYPGMRFATRLMVCCLAVTVLGLAASATTLAQGGGGNSAGNSQYVDPLHNGGGHHSGHGSSSGTSTSGSSTTTTTSGSSTPPPSQSSGAGSTSSSPQAAGRTLPYTGLNLEACVGLGLALLAAGFGLRRILAATR
jgi:hypothetical protein